MCAQRKKPKSYFLVCKNFIPAEINSVLASGDVSESRIRAAVIAMQGQITDGPFAKLFQLNGTESLAVGYEIAQGGDAIPDTQPFLDFHDRAYVDWSQRAKAPTQSDFRGCTFSVSYLNSPNPSEAWFLVWGKTIGDTGARVKLRLYTFDGVTVRTLWQRDGLTGGEVSVDKNSVILEYDRMYRSNDPGNRVREVLHVGPSGLQ